MIKDTRIAFGAFCTWWGSIHEVAKGNSTGRGIPTCPHCGGVLYEEPNSEDWEKRLQSVPEEKYPRYVEVMKWQHENKISCSKSWRELREKFDNRTSQ